MGTFVWLKWKQLLQNTNVEKVYNFRNKSEAGKLHVVTNGNGHCETMQVFCMLRAIPLAEES